MTSFYEYRRQQRIKAEEEQDKKNLENGVWDTPDFYSMRYCLENGVWNTPDFYAMRNSTGPISEAVQYDKKFHDDPDVKPLNLSQYNIDAIAHYTSTSPRSEHGYASSENMNNHMNNLNGANNKIIGSHSIRKIEESIQKLKDAFTPENTNKKIITTTGAVRRHQGEQLEKSKSLKLHSFRSTSSDQSHANGHTKRYVENTENGIRHDHIVDYKVHPGCGLSVVQHSDYIENEVLLKPGVTMKRLSTQVHEIGPNHFLKIHEVEVK